MEMTTKPGQGEGLPVEDFMEEEEINLRELWNVLRQYRKSIIAITLMAMTLATLIVFSMKPIYLSTATLLIETEEQKVLSIEEVYSGGQQSREYLNTQFEVIKSNSLAKNVIDNLSLKTHPYFQPDQSEDGIGDSIVQTLLAILPDAITAWFDSSSTGSNNGSMNAGFSADELFIRGIQKRFSGMMTVSPIRNTQLVQISFEATDNRLAALMANEMAQVYINDQMDSRLGMTAQANTWLSERITNVREKLKQSEIELQAYREREKLIEVGSVTTLIAKQLQELNQELLSAQQKLASLAAASGQISQIESGNYQNYLSIPAVLGDALVSQLIKGASDKQQDLDTLSERYGPKHPKIIAAKVALNTANKALKNHVLSVVGGIDRQYQLARSSESSTQQLLANTRQKMQNINRKEHQLGLLQREVDANQQMYGLFLNRIKETTESRGSDKANARIVDPAVAAITPIKPKKKLIILITGILGLAFGVLMAFLFAYLNNTLKSAVDIEERLQLVVLGVLPVVKEKLGDLWRLVSVDSKSTYTEGIRTIRTGVILSSLDEPHKVIMITSSLPSEGKSIIASNTAINLSEMHRVLLIDADLRKPIIANLFGMEKNTNGLAELMAGTADTNACVHRWGDSQLHIMPSGLVPPNPLDLFSSNAFKTMLEKFSKHFDHIIIDTPPVLPVSDALIISTMANGVIFVIKADATPLPIAIDALKRLRQSRAHILGAVLNQFDEKKHRQYGEYGNYAYTGGYYTEGYGVK